MWELIQKARIKMLILVGTVLNIMAGKPDHKTGEIHPVVQIQHKTSQGADAEIVIDKIKLKHNGQADAFKKALGKTIKVPVRTWNTSSGGSGYWLEEGVLPTVEAVQAAA